MGLSRKWWCFHQRIAAFDSIVSASRHRKMLCGPTHTPRSRPFARSYVIYRGSFDPTPPIVTLVPTKKKKLLPVISASEGCGTPRIGNSIPGVASLLQVRASLRWNVNMLPLLFRPRLATCSRSCMLDVRFFLVHLIMLTCGI